MKENWKEAFSFNHRERKGTTVLLIINLAVFAYWVLEDHLFPQQYNLPNIEKIAYPIPFEELPAQNSKPQTRKDFSLFRFDPNTVSDQELSQMGFKSFERKMLINYREAGGEFYDLNDFQRLYFVNDSIVDRFLPFLTFPKKTSKVAEQWAERRRFDSIDENPEDTTRQFIKPIRIHKTTETKFMVAMNGSDTSDWKRFNGIGSGYANRIVTYRSMLGGFVKKEQLLEVYGLDTALYHRIVHQLEVDSNLVNRIDINRASTTYLSRHPYITWNMARIITDSRRNDGPYESVSELRKRNLFNEALYTKIAGYLEVE